MANVRTERVQEHPPAEADGARLLCVPEWVESLFVGGGVHELRQSVGPVGEMRIETREVADALLVTVEIPAARSLDVAALRMGTRRAYVSHREIAGDSWHPVRIWNYIPGITEPLRDGLDRYKAFNLGRHDAVSNWFRDEHQEFDRLPPATGVGHAGDELTIHMLMLRTPPVMVENPRQRPAFRYSNLHGPKPPCFSRASIVRHAGTRSMLIAGTASILGETSIHQGRIGDQILETVASLRALVCSVLEHDTGPAPRLDHVRAYSPDPENDGLIREALDKQLDGGRFEIVRAELCRKELLVEIEGIADLSASSLARAGRYAADR